MSTSDADLAGRLRAASAGYDEWRVQSPVDLQWSEAPRRTEWGDGMMEALIALGPDHTARIYAHKDALGAMQALPAYEIGRLRTAAMTARAALSELLAMRDPVVYADALRALDEALGPRDKPEG
jgi:hypothetical protein